MIEKLASFGAAVGISMGAAAFQTMVVPKEHSLGPALPANDAEVEPQALRERQLHILTEGLRFEDLTVDAIGEGSSQPTTANSVDAPSDATVATQGFNSPIKHLIDGLTLLEEYEDVDLSGKIAALPRPGGLQATVASGRSRSLSLTQKTEKRETRPLLRRSGTGYTRKRPTSPGGGGGFVGARSAQTQLGGSAFPVGAASSNNNSVAASIDTFLQSPAATQQNSLLASNVAGNESFLQAGTGTTTGSSGRPQLTADGKYGIPNHQYWTFDFTDQNNDNVVNSLDADLHFADYLTGLEADLEAAKQVVKFSPTELQSIYSDLNSQVPPEKSPSYLTFMIIDFPVKGFYLPFDEIPDNPGLPPGAVD
ncbi:MAG: hypothetical protein Aurels2KO_31660 [Aureliella sp.]